MPKIVCDFTFDSSSYCVVAELDRHCTVRDVMPLDGNKGLRAQDVRNGALLLGGLIKNNVPFSYFEDMTSIGPLQKAIVAAISRERDKAVRAAAKPMGDASRRMIDGEPL